MNFDTKTLFKKTRRNFWKKFKKAEAADTHTNQEMPPATPRTNNSKSNKTQAIAEVTPAYARYAFAPPPISHPQESEVWCEIPKIPFYYASTLGRICFVDGGLVSQAKSKYGRATVSLRIASGVRYRNGYGTRQVHRLVAETFVPNLNPKFCTRVAHIDGDKQNNRAANLAWTRLMPAQFQKRHARDSSSAAPLARDNTSPMTDVSPTRAEMTYHIADVSPTGAGSAPTGAETPYHVTDVSPTGAGAPDPSVIGTIELLPPVVSEPEVWLPTNIWHEGNFECFVDPMLLTGQPCESVYDDPFSSPCDGSCAEDTQPLSGPLFERQEPLASA